MEPAEHNSSWTDAAVVLALLFALPVLLVQLGERAAYDAARPAAQQRLSAAAEAGDVEAVRRLLERGARVNGTDASACTPLFFAARGGHADIVKVLIAHGADVHAGSPIYGQPLIRAAMNEQVDVVIALLAAGADPHVRDRAGNTALWYAGTTGNARMVAVLRAAGAEVGATPQTAEAVVVSIRRRAG